MVDVEKIKLAVQNLIENAIKYTPNRGSIEVNLRANKKEVELSVKDTGVGIPEDQKSRIFTKFFRGSNVVRIDTEGSGLGLFISKNIIEAHGGRIWFDSEEGVGTTFYFTLPVKEEFGEFMKDF
jgi:signal transduction histidine kinase